MQECVRFSMATRREPAPIDDAKAILNRIRLFVRALRTLDKQAQSRYGFGAAQLFILHVLKNEDELSLNDLADRTATDQSSVSLAVGKLVADGYVHRETNAKDRRQVRLSLTTKGRALVRRAPPAAQERMIESIGEMTSTERKQLTKLLDKLMGGMGVSTTGRAPMLFLEEEPKKRTRRS